MKELFTADNVPPKALVRTLDDSFTREWMDWLPETLYQEIDRVWGVDPSEKIKNKLGAIKVFYTTDLWYHDAAAFEHIVLAMNDTVCDTSILEMASPEEILFAVMLLGPFDKNKFEREITAYVSACCEQAGLLVFPSQLSFAQPKLTNPVLKAAAGKIEARQIDGDLNDMVVVQSNKLFYIQKAVAERFLAFDVALLQEN